MAGFLLFFLVIQLFVSLNVTEAQASDQEEQIAVLQGIRSDLQKLQMIEHELEHIDYRLEIISYVFIGILIVLVADLILRFRSYNKKG